jgi:two-component system, NarL family, nitrate/nitrite response regulator NarL
LIATNSASPFGRNRRLLIVADDPLARTGLSTLLTEQSDFTVTGQIAGTVDLLPNIGVYAPDMLVWDMGWEPSAALERLADLADADIPVLALLADAAHAADAWVAGARGLFLRSTRIESIVSALDAVVDGLIVVDPALGSALLSPRERAIAPPTETLTARELEVLQYVAEGLPNKIIAQRLGISESTIKFHVNAIMSKLGAQSRTDAVVRATRLGLVIL